MLTKKLLLWFYDTYNAVMDADQNPLKSVPDPVSRFWIMTVLAWCWCIAFGLYIGSVLFLGTSFLAHVALLMMVFFTASVFYDAEQNNAQWLSSWRAELAPATVKRSKQQ